jgi:hypothetical protein
MPEFWTWIIIYLDSELFSLKDFRSQLEWSGDLIIHVTITSMTDLFSTRELEENRRVCDVTTILIPHIRRCETIRYDVAHSSSLPLISTDLYFSTPHLKQLSLESSTQSESNTRPSAGLLQPLDGVRSELCFPAVTELTLDGWNFLKLYHDKPKWADIDVSLSISHFRSSDTPGGRLTIRDAFLFFTHNISLSSLELIDVEFDELDAPIDDISLAYSPVSSILISHLSSRMTAAILSCFYDAILQFYDAHLKWVSITSCPLDAVENAPIADGLMLDSIPSTDGLCRYLSSWSGVWLYIQNCHTFNNEVLDFLGSMYDHDDGTPSQLCLSDLREISLHECTNFSISALKQMIRARQQKKGGPSTLNISGRAPRISKEDEDWFIENVMNFDVRSLFILG